MKKNKTGTSKTRFIQNHLMIVIMVKMLTNKRVKFRWKINCK